MLKLKSILVPSDLSESSRNAYRVARDLADQFHAAVHVLYVTPTSGQFDALFRWLTDRESGQSSLEEAHDRRIVEALERDYTGYEPIKHVHRKGSSVAGTVLDYAEDCSVDLIVMGTHGHRSLEHPALGGMTGEIVRNSPGPVLTVRTRDDEQLDFRGFSRIVVALDFGEESREVLRAAKQLASCYDAAMSLLFVAEEHQVPVFSDTGLVSLTTLKVDEEIASRSNEALQQIDEETGSSDLDREHIVRRGRPAKQIVEYAEESNADLIVIGRRGHAPHEGLLVGTVTEHVVRRSPCPVLTFGSGRSES